MSAPTLASPNAAAELAALADELRNAALDLVWRQWRALGAGAAATAAAPSAARGAAGRDAGTIVDPEALVLVSLQLMDRERRLADLLSEWAAHRAALLSVQRVKNLMLGHPEELLDALAGRVGWFASVAYTRGKDLRWRSLLGAGTADAPPLRAPKARSAQEHFTRAASLVLRLRLAFGVGVKADVLAVLLGRADDWATVRELTEATAYTPAAVRRGADDLAASGLIQWREKQPAEYRVVYARWSPLLALGDRPPVWVAWHQQFRFVTAFSRWADVTRTRELSEYAFGAHGRDLVERHPGAFDWPSTIEPSLAAAPESGADAVRRAVRALVRGMGGEGAGQPRLT
ncbi:MAG: hypothetical protein WD771_04990 [Gemmatimonadaceae bacterium]